MNKRFSHLILNSLIRNIYDNNSMNYMIKYNKFDDKRNKFIRNVNNVNNNNNNNQLNKSSNKLFGNKNPIK